MAASPSLVIAALKIAPSSPSYCFAALAIPSIIAASSAASIAAPGTPNNSAPSSTVLPGLSAIISMASCSTKVRDLIRPRAPQSPKSRTRVPLMSVFKLIKKLPAFSSSDIRLAGNQNRNQHRGFFHCQYHNLPYARREDKMPSVYSPAKKHRCSPHVHRRVGHPAAARSQQVASCRSLMPPYHLLPVD